jgi:hypothetical protein
MWSQGLRYQLTTCHASSSTLEAASEASADRPTPGGYIKAQSREAVADSFLSSSIDHSSRG